MYRFITAVSTFVCAGTLFVGCSNPDREKREHFERGKAYVEQKAYKEAVLEFRTAVQLDEKFGEARYALALAYEKTGDFAQTLREMVRAADLLPDDAVLQLRAGRLLMAAGSHEDAATRAKKVLDRDPQNVDALIVFGNASSGMKNSDQAIAVLEQALKMTPGEERLLESLGELQRSRGELPAAEASFKRAVAIAPNSVEARQALAGYYFAVGRIAEVERVLVEALSIDSGSAVSRDLAVLYFVSGRNDDAQRQIAKVLESTPDDIPMRFALGDVFLRTRKFDDALRAYEAIPAKDPLIAASAHARMALVEYEAGRRDQARERLKVAIQSAPKSAELHGMLARLYLADRSFKEAEVAARAALQFEPDRAETQAVLASAVAEQGRIDEALPLLRKATETSPAAPAPRVQLARAYFERGDYASAQRLAKEALARYPGDPLSRLMLIRSLTAAGNLAEAEEVLRPFERAFPQSPQTRIARGDLAFAKNDLASARRAYADALTLDPRSSEALTGLTRVELRAGRTADAIGLISKAVAEQPANPTLRLLSAEAFLATNDFKSAEEALQAALKVDGNSMSAYGLLGGLYFRQKRLDEARVQFEKMAAQAPNAVGPSTMLGVILQLQGKPKDAQAAYERLLQNSPDAAVAANNSAMLLAEAGENLDVALDRAQAAKRVLPNDADVNDTLGLVYVKKGLFSLALPPLEQAVQSNPQSIDGWLHLGQAHLGVGNREKARNALNRVVSLDPKSSHAAQAQSALAGLR